MFARGRGGPRQATPANVQCQKCLKRGHYSYECKASTQDRPYVSRPSRSKQLRNPKLVPKLTSDTLNPLEKKKGIADEEIAKQEAERARKRELEERDDELIRSAPKRQRSVSSDSVSTISTNASADSRRRSLSRSPPPRRRHLSPDEESDRDVRSSRRDDSRSISPPPRRRRSISRDSRSPPPRRRRSVSRDSRSPPREPRAQSYRSRDASPPSDYDGRMPRRRRRYSSVSRTSRDSRPHRRDLSRSPDANRRGVDERGRDAPARGRGEGRLGGGPGPSERFRGPPAQEAPRERSLSPFSKRLALTKAMNSGGR